VNTDPLDRLAQAWMALLGLVALGILAGSLAFLIFDV
jgi:hypothetical protein